MNEYEGKAYIESCEPAVVGCVYVVVT